MKIEALIRILQYCEDNNIDVDYGTNGRLAGWNLADNTNQTVANNPIFTGASIKAAETISSVKRCLVKCINAPNDFFTKNRLYIGTIIGSNIEIEEDNEGDLHSRHVSNFKIIKEI